MTVAAVSFSRTMPLVAQQAAPAAIAGPILLSSNENPYGPIAGAAAAMRDALLASNRYPDSQYDDFVRGIAAFHKVHGEQVLAGNGSTELLRIAADAFTGPGRKLILADPTFEAIRAYAGARSAQIAAVPLTSGFAHDLDRMLVLSHEGTGLVYICNPNNPTGSLTPRSDIEAFISRLPENVFVLIDEAYHEFAVGAPEYTSFLDRPIGNPRVVVVRTFSKVYGLAGLRLGYGIAARDAVALMRPFQLLDNLNMVAARAGLAAMSDAAGVREAVRRNALDRAEFLRQASQRGVTAIPSYSNFLMIVSPVSAPDAIEHF
jgi:histidinol-phosphate aminotransferase